MTVIWVKEMWCKNNSLVSFHCLIKWQYQLFFQTPFIFEFLPDSDFSFSIHVHFYPFLIFFKRWWSFFALLDVLYRLFHWFTPSYYLLVSFVLSVGLLQVGVVYFGHEGLYGLPHISNHFSVLHLTENIFNYW
jgi:hypothetical protein